MLKEKNPSNSEVQTKAGEMMVKAFASQMFKEDKLIILPDELPSELKKLKPDGYIEGNERVVIEAYAHIGKLKGSQPDKVAHDFLKLIWARELLQKNDFNKIRVIMLVDKSVSEHIERMRLGEIADHYSIEVFYQEIDEQTTIDVKKAQERQAKGNNE